MCIALSGTGAIPGDLGDRLVSVPHKGMRNVVLASVMHFSEEPQASGSCEADTSKDRRRASGGQPNDQLLGLPRGASMRVRASKR